MRRLKHAEVIVGGSYIGLEFAQLMCRLGAAVTVAERSPRLLQREDADVSECIRAILEAEGVRFALNAECLSLAPCGQWHPGRRRLRWQPRHLFDADPRG